MRNMVTPRNIASNGQVSVPNVQSNIQQMKIDDVAVKSDIALSKTVVKNPVNGSKIDENHTSSQESNGSEESASKKQKMLETFRTQLIIKKSENEKKENFQFKTTKDDGTGIILITCWFDNIEVGFILVRGSAIKDFLCDEEKFGPFQLPFFRRVETLNNLKTLYGENGDVGWKFLKDILENKNNIKYSFESMNFLATFSDVINEVEYENIKSKIMNYVKDERPHDCNNVSKRCFLDQRTKYLSECQRNGIFTILDIFA